MGRGLPKPCISKDGGGNLVRSDHCKLLLLHPRANDLVLCPVRPTLYHFPLLNKFINSCGQPTPAFRIKLTQSFCWTSIRHALICIREIHIPNFGLASAPQLASVFTESSLTVKRSTWRHVEEERGLGTGSIVQISWLTGQSLSLPLSLVIYCP